GSRCWLRCWGAAPGRAGPAPQRSPRRSGPGRISRGCSSRASLRDQSYYGWTGSDEWPLNGAAWPALPRINWLHRTVCGLKRRFRGAEMKPILTMILALAAASAAGATQAADLALKACPAGGLHVYPLAPGKRFQSLVVPNIAIENAG